MGYDIIGICIYIYIKKGTLMCGVNVFVFVSRHVNMEKSIMGSYTVYIVICHIYSHLIMFSYRFS